jgi:hypothetical protein
MAVPVLLLLLWQPLKQSPADNILHPNQSSLGSITIIYDTLPHLLVKMTTEMMGTDLINHSEWRGSRGGGLEVEGS